MKISVRSALVRKPDIVPLVFIQPGADQGLPNKAISRRLMFRAARITGILNLRSSAARANLANAKSPS